MNPRIRAAILFAALWFFACLPALAQNLNAYQVTTLQNAATATGNGTALDTTPMAAVSVQITGTFVGTVTFEGTLDGSNWIALEATNANDDSRATTATAPGIYSVVLHGSVRFRARVSAYTSGDITVKARLQPGMITRNASGGGGGSGTVTTFSAGNLSPLFTSSVANATSTPALSFSLSNATANRVFAGPTTGSPAAPTFRALVAGDLPSGIPYGNLNLTGAILNADLAGSIANAKLANSSLTIAGTSVSLGGSISASSVLDSIGSTQGQILYRGASGWAVLAPGTSGQILQSGGAAANPSWTTASSVSGANPTASVGLSAVNGLATTFMRSDGAPALDQAIAPTWTGAHAFSNTITQTSNSATAFQSGPNGGTNPVFRLVNNTASSATGLSITGNAAGSGVTLTALSSGTNENVILNPKGSGVLQVGGSGNKIQGDTTSQTLELSSANGSILSYSGTKFFAGGAANVQISSTAIEQWTSTNAAVGSTTTRSWTSSGAANTSDLWLRRNAAANLGLGATISTTAPVAQTISMESATGTNTAGATFTMVGSLGTSQGTPGILDFQTGGLIAASGTTAQTAVSRQVLGASKVLANNTTTTVTNVTVASNTVAAGVVDYTVEVFDGTNLQLESGSFTYQVTNKGGTIANNTITAPTGFPKNTTTSGTLTTTWTITAANPALLQINANSSLTPSTGYPRVTYTVRNLTQQAIAPQ